ncbi:MAG TPA: flagellar hook-associated protein FlgL [Polyangiales bacterium]|nr:flagellar hook-associated protein FlgL [Polyangiales bacterium]
MRVSDNAKFASVTKNVQKAQSDFVSAQQKAGSGLRVAKPSDDPVAAAQARREASRKALGAAGISAADAATDQLSGADQALDDVYSGLDRARELALQGASDTMSKENRSDLAQEMRKIRDQMVSLGNSKVGDKYVFAGYRDQTAPFEQSGTFVGDGNIKEVQPVPGMRVAASISGASVFGSGAPNDTFSTLDSLIAGLESNDPEAIRGQLDHLQASQDRVVKSRSVVGSLMDSVELGRNVADQQQARATSQIASLTEVDAVQSALNLMQAKSALEAAITVAGQIPQGLAQRG